jgi:mannose-6-phosphate isomerase
MRTLPARPGEVIFIPAGTVHAIGAGVLLYEIQQPSTITYRLDDWGRVDDKGQPRELHVEEALAVSEPELRPESEVAPTRTAAMPAHPCVHCDAFALEVIALGPGDELRLASESGPTVFTCIDGAAQLSADGEVVQLTKGETAVMLADGPPLSLHASSHTRILRGWID